MLPASTATEAGERPAAGIRTRPMTRPLGLRKVGTAMRRAETRFGLAVPGPVRHIVHAR